MRGAVYWGGGGTVYERVGHWMWVTVYRGNHCIQERLL